MVLAWPHPKEGDPLGGAHYSFYTSGQIRFNHGVNAPATMVRENPAEAQAAAVQYLRAVSHLVVGNLWLRAAHIASQKLEAGEDKAFYQAKLATADFYFARLLPEAAYHLEAGKAGSDTLMTLAEEAF